MAFVLIRVEVQNMNDTQLNQLLRPGKPHEGVVQLRNLMDSIMGGTTNAEVVVSVRATTLAIPVDGSGQTATYNLK